jgi:hypothetical protein
MLCCFLDYHGEAFPLLSSIILININFFLYPPCDLVDMDCENSKDLLFFFIDFKSAWTSVFCLFYCLFSIFPKSINHHFRTWNLFIFESQLGFVAFYLFDQYISFQGQKIFHFSNSAEFLKEIIILMPIFYWFCTLY